MTPVEKQYAEAKAAFPDAIVMLRLGDFFELFGDDAVVASRVLGITLTTRDKNKDNPTPMAGVPHHAVDAYIARLIAEGLRVALCDQIEDPKNAKGIVARAITRVITPGVVLEGDALASTERRLLGALAAGEGGPWSTVWLDFSTGELRVAQHRSEAEALAWLDRSDIFEWVAADAQARESLCSRFAERSVVRGERYALPAAALSELLPLMPRPQLDPALADPTAQRCVLTAAGYVRHIQLGQMPRLRMDAILRESFDLDLDSTRNLEIFEAGLERSRAGSLLSVIDRTQTAAGRRRLADWLRSPLQSTDAIRARQQYVIGLTDGDPLADSRRSALRRALAHTTDCERLAMRLLHRGAVGGKDLAALRNTLQAWQLIVGHAELTAILAPLWAQVPALADLQLQLERALAAEPAATVAKGDVIASGWDATLDTLRGLRDSSEELLHQLEVKIQAQYDLPSAKIRYNRVFGYYIELPRAQARSAPPEFIRKQTLTNAERFETAELRELSAQALTASEDALAHEERVLADVLGRVAARAADLIALGRTLAELDALASLAETARDNRWHVPQVSERFSEDNVVQGAHPHLQSQLGARFITNDTVFDTARRFHILTGPNMGGKSTYLKQIGQLYLLAHIGSYVPAERMQIHPVDQIFTRVGAGDDIARGESTFMVEMRQCAHIVARATRHSLVLLDEVGRGTSTYDGLSIAWALVEHLHAGTTPRAVFATHYHELAELESICAGVQTYAMEVKEWQGSVVFQHRVVPGAASHSYGIHVAALAGLPEPLLATARAKLVQLENQRMGSGALAGASPNAPADRATPAAPTALPTAVAAAQQSLFESAERELLRRISRETPMRLTPLQALEKLDGYRAEAAGILDKG